MGEINIKKIHNVHKEYRKMNLVNPYWFNTPPNTFIGGVSATLNTPNLVAARLGISVDRVNTFKIVGANIEFAVLGGSYNIPSSAFSGFTSLTYFNDSLGLVPIINYGAFYGCTSAISYNFPALVTLSNSSGLNQGIFQNNTALASFSAPILTTMVIGGPGGGSTFQGCSSLVTFSAPNLSSPIRLNSFQGCLNLTTVTAGSITAIGDDAFNGCAKLKNIDLSHSTTIGARSFNGCILLDQITSLNSATTIGLKAFYNCQKLPTFTSNYITTIGTSAFYNCYMVTSYNFPALTIFDTSTSAGTSGTFQNNTALITFSAPVLTSITGTGSAFFGNNNMTTFNAPNLAGALGSYMFQGCAKLVTFTVGAVTSINGNFFNGCALISSIYMPSLVTCGSTTGNDNVFLNIKTGITITVKTSLKTANAGAPDGDLVYAIGTRSAIVTYV